MKNLLLRLLSFLCNTQNYQKKFLRKNIQNIFPQSNRGLTKHFWVGETRYQLPKSILQYKRVSLYAVLIFTILTLNGPENRGKPRITEKRHLVIPNLSQLANCPDFSKNVTLGKNEKTCAIRAYKLYFNLFYLPNT